MFRRTFSLWFHSNVLFRWVFNGSNAFSGHFFCENFWWEISSLSNSRNDEGRSILADFVWRTISWLRECVNNSHEPQMLRISSPVSPESGQLYVSFCCLFVHWTDRAESSNINPFAVSLRKRASSVLSIIFFFLSFLWFRDLWQCMDLCFKLFMVWIPAKLITQMRRHDRLHSSTNANRERQKRKERNRKCAPRRAENKNETTKQKRKKMKTISFAYVSHFSHSFLFVFVKLFC